MGNDILNIYIQVHRPRRTTSFIPIVYEKIGNWSSAHAYLFLGSNLTFFMRKKLGNTQKVFF